MTEPVARTVAQDAFEVSDDNDLNVHDSGRAARGSAAEERAGAEDASASDGILAELEALVAERTDDLKRVQAEYINYKKRVERDRALARQGGIEAVLRDLMPVFDSIIAAADHNDLTGGFKLTADELTKVTKSYGFESFGQVGEEFDPRLHEALMQVLDSEVEVMTLHEVMQVGYRVNDLVIRPARVVVAVPEIQ